MCMCSNGGCCLQHVDNEWHKKSFKNIILPGVFFLEFQMGNMKPLFNPSYVFQSLGSS